MTLHLGNVPANSTLYIPFATYGADGESLTLSGLAVTDIEIYKAGSVTQRSSDAGYALLDTDGIDFDGITGIHGFSIDLSDNTDSGFYAVGSQYWVIVSAVTINTQTVNFIAATFRIGPAESITGHPKVDVGGLGGDAQSLTDLKDFADAGYDPSTNKVQGVVLVDTTTDVTTKTGYGLADDAITAAKFDQSTAFPLASADGSDLTEAGGTGDHLTAINLPNQTMDIVGNITGNLSGSVGSVTGAVGSVTGNVGGNVTGSIGSLAAQAKLDVNAEADTAISDAALATAANLATVAGYLDTEIAAIKAKTDNLPADPAGLSDLATAHGAGSWATATGFSTHSAADVITAMGTGTFLTAIPWNANWDAEVQSEVVDAIAAEGVPRVGETHRYTNVDTSATADVTISEAS